MNTAKHTPTPWTKSILFIVSNKTLIADVRLPDQETLGRFDLKSPGEQCSANAAHIVHCVNCHDELVEELRSVTDFLEQAYDEIYHDTSRAKIIHARQALAKAEEK